MGSLVRTTQYTFVPAPKLIAPASSILFVHSILARHSWLQPGLAPTQLLWVWLLWFPGPTQAWAIASCCMCQGHQEGHRGLSLLGPFCILFHFSLPQRFFFFFSFSPIFYFNKEWTIISILQTDDHKKQCALYLKGECHDCPLLSPENVHCVSTIWKKRCGGKKKQFAARLIIELPLVQ